MYQSIYETNAGYPNWNIIIFGKITIRKETATHIYRQYKTKTKMRTTLIQTTSGSKTKCYGRVSYPV